MDTYVCINPECPSYLMDVERPKECSNPVCNDCEEKLQKESWLTFYTKRPLIGLLIWLIF